MPVKPVTVPPLPVTARMPLKGESNTVVELTEQAIALRSVHVERDGICAGCLDMWARLAPHPCPQADWAERVLQQATPTA